MEAKCQWCGEKIEKLGRRWNAKGRVFAMCCPSVDSPEGLHEPASQPQRQEEAASVEQGEPMPCPFCGATPFAFSAVGKWKVECSRLDDGCGVETAFYSKKEEAIAAWNNRR